MFATTTITVIVIAIVIAIVITIVIAIVIVIVWSLRQRPMTGGYLSPRAGPVDMLQQPKQLLFDGYRFQDALIPPSPDHKVMTQRVGIFKDKAYVIEGLETTQSS
jgi:MFS superfamily sulfate permease-like transporter